MSDRTLTTPRGVTGGRATGADDDLGRVSVTVMAELVTDDGARPAPLQWQLNATRPGTTDGCPTWCDGTDEAPWPEDCGVTHERDIAEASFEGFDEAGHADTVAEILRTVGENQFADAVTTAADLVRSIESEAK